MPLTLSPGAISGRTTGTTSSARRCFNGMTRSSSSAEWVSGAAPAIQNRLARNANRNSRGEDFIVLFTPSEATRINQMFLPEGVGETVHAYALAARRCMYEAFIAEIDADM